MHVLVQSIMFQHFTILCMHVHVHGARCSDDLAYSSVLLASRRAGDITNGLSMPFVIHPYRSIVVHNAVSGQA